ncbi:cyclophilin-like fold protein [Candidatus Jidaibacter acanthamoebae]|nr:cyclophilin-like fold protein [Candidatus Jidaibacter acanthamoeba]
MKKASLPMLAIAIFLAWPAYAQEDKMKIKITINHQTVTATMEDSPTARDFISLLPLTLTLDDYSKTEKISDLPKKLTKEGAPAAINPKAGDIAFYAPWGNLAIFYRDGHHSPGLIKLGKMDSSMEVFKASDSMKATIEILNNGGK